ncbi:signal recognition particle 68 kDa protein [Plectosphaerella cucumerina]|uniref:Signal recognition particle subunit SRP68 n=1 Tax=Plectosphaerella cucumerina TaxID=40658 RepID=A0A8K0TSK1_9PEZI|nr:signal recognition particle 68 kDa protein [Plectosphaerella cucumerina]
MDITKFVVSGRDAALLYGDYSTYQAQLGTKLANCRRKLGISTRNRGKFQTRDDVTPEQVAEHNEYIHLLLLTSERAWANAMSIKAHHSADSNGIGGRTRKHIVSRLDKAARNAEDLVEILSDAQSGASRNDQLEARGYAALIRGAAYFEKAAWEPSVRSYSVARILYSALASATKSEIFKDLLSETIDPSIRFAAYQLKTPRTIPIPAIARRAFPQDDEWLVQQVNELDSGVLRQGDADSKKSAENAPRTLNWRSREVQIEDAAISLAWGRVEAAKARLAEQVSSLSDADARDIATAYDDILAATQDTVDATKEAIDDLRGEGVSQSDPRMQSLQITRTAVGFEMISWRIGRNRVLTGDRDGAVENYQTASRKKSKKEPSPAQKIKDESHSRKAAKLRELVALYEGILQSVETIRELPGVAADEDLAEQLAATTQYFEALKALSVARSHDVLGNAVNALALIKHAHDLAHESAEALSQVPQPPSGSARNIQVTAEDAEYLQKFLTGELQRHRALVHIFNLQQEAAKAEAMDTQSVPLIERLHEYPFGPVDLSRIVDIPPKVTAIPVKPIFLDIAWNYIDYPRGKGAAPAGAKPAQQQKSAAPAATPAEKEAPQTQKKGWFGFGR